jgi:hypothetical protein
MSKKNAIRVRVMNQYLKYLGALKLLTECYDHVPKDLQERIFEAVTDDDLPATPRIAELQQRLKNWKAL